jgi:hypothetical protein
MSPKAEALAYRIYCYANPKGWDCTMGEVADALGVGVRAISHVAEIKDWSTRFRRAGYGYERPRSPACSDALMTGAGVNVTVAHYARLADEAPE